MRLSEELLSAPPSPEASSSDEALPSPQLASFSFLPSPQPDGQPSVQPSYGFFPSPPMSLQQLHLFVSSLTLGNGWVDETRLERIRLCKLSNSSVQPTVSHSIVIESDFSWKVYMYGHEVKIADCSSFEHIPDHLDSTSLQKLMLAADACTICPGNPDSHFVTMCEARKDQFVSVKGEVTAYNDKNCIIDFGGKQYSRTVRTSNCSIGVTRGRCKSCAKFRPSLRARYSRWKKKSQSPRKFSNNRYLNTPQKAKKLSHLQARALSAEREVRVLSERIAAATNANNIRVDPEMHSYLKSIIEENNSEVSKKFLEGSFQRLFWEQQMKAAQVSRASSMKWHPMMVRWCLNLKLLSTSCYRALRTSGFMKLPSERSLRDYTHYVKARSGFQDDIDADLVKEACLKDLPEWKRYVVLLIDEMKVKESLVYDKVGAKIIGFADLGDVNNQLIELEESYRNDSPQTSLPGPVATHMLVMMVRGIFMHLSYPYAHFPTSDLTGASLFMLVWEGIERLETLGFKVLAVTGDGVSVNRKCFKLHSSAKTCYKTKNPYTEDDRDLFFISDVPHLLKTTRNCWSHTGAHGSTRHLWVCLHSNLQWRRVS